MNAFVEAEGLVHLINPVNGEFTLCGDAFDLASEIDGYAWRSPKSRTITCEHCATIVIACRGVRVTSNTSRRPDNEDY